MSTQTIGIILNGATGRIGSTQHLQNALVPIRVEGGLRLGDVTLVPKLLLVGRDAQRLAAVAKAHGIAEWTTDLDGALSDPAYAIYFDATANHERVAVLARAIAAGKHIYAEKPVVGTVEEGRRLLQLAREKGIKHGAVEDKVHLAGLRKLAHLIEAGYFGTIISFRLELGWWVFDGFHTPCQRSSWNYRRATGGGLVLDMYPHWRYVIEGIVGPIRRVVSMAWTGTPERVDEQGRAYRVDVEDTAATIVELESGACGTIFSSWATRVRRDELLTLQVDGTRGSAIAGVHHCRTQSVAQTPKVQWSPDRDLQPDYFGDWGEVPDNLPVRQSYRAGWEDFLRHVVTDAPFKSDLSAGIRDVALAEACYRSAAERRWVELEAVA